MDGAPWSDITIRMEMQRLHERIDDELSLLKVLGEKKARATDQRVKHEGAETLRAKFEQSRLSSDALRRAHVVANTPVGDLLLEEELATALYWDQKELIVTLRQDMSMMQTMLRSAEDNVRSMEGSRTRPHQESHRRRQ